MLGPLAATIVAKSSTSARPAPTCLAPNAIKRVARAYNQKLKEFGMAARQISHFPLAQLRCCWPACCCLSLAVRLVKVAWIFYLQRNFSCKCRCGELHQSVHESTSSSRSRFVQLAHICCRPTYVDRRSLPTSGSLDARARCVLHTLPYLMSFSGAGNVPMTAAAAAAALNAAPVRRHRPRQSRCMRASWRRRFSRPHACLPFPEHPAACRLRRCPEISTP